MRTAVILCAGTGTRLRALAGGAPKPLVRVAGREILYRTLYLLSKAGVEEFVVVVNPHSKDPLESFLKRTGVSYSLVINDQPQRENGYSLLLASDSVREDRFVLTMGDHLYSEEFVVRAVEGEGIIVDSLALFTDRKEATKVLCEEGRVKDIGKEIPRFTGYDTGFFVLERDIFEVADRLAKKKEKLTLSEIVREARLKCTFVSGRFWTDVDTPEDLRRARRELIRSSVKGSGDGFVARYLNRKLSLWVSERLVEKVTPNQATGIVFLIGVLSALIALLNPPLGGLLYQLSSMLDGIDGEIARASMRTTKFGGWLDSVLDRFVDFSFLSALALRIEPSGHALLWVLSALFGSLMVSYTTERFRGAYQEDAYRVLPLLRYLPGRRDERILFTAIMTLMGWLLPLFVVLSLVTNLRVLLTLYLVWRERGSE